MTKATRPHRCGQCGRTFTKAQWRRNDFWCPNCEKFVCYGCVTRGMVCPACGTKTNRNMRRLLSLGGAFGAAFLFQGSFGMFVTRLGSTIFWMSFGLLVGASFCILAVLISLIFLREQKRKHNAHLSKMPDGVIPLKERVGSGDPVAYGKWREANLERSPRRASLMKGVYSDYSYLALRGDWNLPILSKEERDRATMISMKWASQVGVAMTGLGVVILLFGIFVVQQIVPFGFGVVLTLFGVLILVLASTAKEAVGTDVKAEVYVAWKTVGLRGAKNALEEFIRKRGWEVDVKRTEASLGTNPEHKYELPDGNCISFTYYEDDSGRVYGWVTIGYRPHNYLAARKLQEDLDEFLANGDLIRRIA